MCLHLIVLNHTQGGETWRGSNQEIKEENSKGQRNATRLLKLFVVSTSTTMILYGRSDKPEKGIF